MSRAGEGAFEVAFSMTDSMSILEGFGRETEDEDEARWWRKGAGDET